MQTEANPFEFLESLSKRANQTLDRGCQIISRAHWDDLDEYSRELDELVAAFSQVKPLMEDIHNQVVEQARIREQERIAEGERRRKAAEERKCVADEFEQNVQAFDIAFNAFKAKQSWANVNAALSVGEIVEQSALFQADKRSPVLRDNLATLRQKHSYLKEVREMAAEMIAEREQVQS
jgi:hypothetical protein